MTDHRAESLEHVAACLAILDDTDEKHAGASLPDRMIATQIAAMTAVLANTHALLHAAEKMAAQNPSADCLLGIYRDGLTAGITEALARFAPCEPESQRAATAEQLVRERLADPAFMVRVSSRINARLGGAA